HIVPLCPFPIPPIHRLYHSRALSDPFPHFTLLSFLVMLPTLTKATLSLVYIPPLLLTPCPSCSFPPTRHLHSTRRIALIINKSILNSSTFHLYDSVSFRLHRPTSALYSTRLDDFDYTRRPNGFSSHIHPLRCITPTFKRQLRLDLNRPNFPLLPRALTRLQTTLSLSLSTISRTSTSSQLYSSIANFRAHSHDFSELTGIYLYIVSETMPVFEFKLSSPDFFEPVPTHLIYPKHMFVFYFPLNYGSLSAFQASHASSIFSGAAIHSKSTMPALNSDFIRPSYMIFCSSQGLEFSQLIVLSRSSVSHTPFDTSFSLIRDTSLKLIRYIPDIFSETCRANHLNLQSSAARISLEV
ncbi:hypothetical protein B0H11DRAFT_2316338, partial [Mycena galericulata]